MTLPPFLILEIRTAFQCARRPPVASFVNRYGTTTRLFAPAPPKPRSNAIPSPRRPEHGEGAIKRTSNENTQDSDDQPKELIPRERTRGALDSGRNVLIPTKVLPKADIAPNLKLSPMQRLHIEHLTRHPPPKKPQKPYKDTLRIYSAGTPTIATMTFTRITALFAAGFITVVWVPAYYSYGTPLPYIALIWALSFAPIFFINHMTRPMITEIFLKLPPSARASPQTAMAYARNLPSDATLRMRYMRWTSIQTSQDVRIVDAVPTKSRYRAMNFRIPRTVEMERESSWWKPALTEFFVRPKTADGRAARDTIPGLWQLVYKRLTGVDVGAVSKWKS